LLEVLGIHVAYGHAKVLHDVSLKLEQGEMVFIVGRNGAGKTTLLQTISGHLKPTAGRILYQGQEINGQPAENLARKGIRFVAQDKKVFSNLTVRGNLELASYASGEGVAQAVERVTRLYPKFQEFLGRKAGGSRAGSEKFCSSAGPWWGNPGCSSSMSRPKVWRPS